MVTLNTKNLSRRSWLDPQNKHHQEAQLRQQANFARKMSPLVFSFPAREQKQGHFFGVLFLHFRILGNLAGYFVINDVYIGI